MIRKNIGKMVVAMLVVPLVTGCAGDIHKTESNTKNVIETVRTAEQREPGKAGRDDKSGGDDNIRKNYNSGGDNNASSDVTGGD